MSNDLALLQFDYFLDINIIEHPELINVKKSLKSEYKIHGFVYFATFF